MTIKELKENLEDYYFEEDCPVILFIESQGSLVMCEDFSVGMDADGENLYILGKECPGAVGVVWS